MQTNELKPSYQKSWTIYIWIKYFQKKMKTKKKKNEYSRDKLFCNQKVKRLFILFNYFNYFYFHFKKKKKKKKKIVIQVKNTITIKTRTKVKKWIVLDI